VKSQRGSGGIILFFYYLGVSFVELDVLKENILKYKHCFIVGPFCLTIKKHFFSVAFIDACYKFTLTDAGGYGKSSDGGILKDQF
jgi:hypothetical protein